MPDYQQGSPPGHGPYPDQDPGQGQYPSPSHDPNPGQYQDPGQYPNQGQGRRPGSGRRPAGLRVLLLSVGALVLVLALVAAGMVYLRATKAADDAVTTPSTAPSALQTTTGSAVPGSPTPGTGATTTATATGTATTTVPTSTVLPTSFAKLQARLGVRAVGLAYAPVGGGPVTQLGTWKAGPAWSTMKVPLALAALKRSNTTATQQLVHKAITASDNQAAEALWSQLGSGRPAADAVDAVLRAHGDAGTHTQAQRVRPPYTAFGQTTWSLASQVAFGSTLACSATDRPVYGQMSQVIAAQRWGLGRLPGAAFKGGWGPDASGRYLVRQFGVVRLGGHLVAVAVAVEPRSGSFDAGVQAMNLVADWMKQNVHPTSGGC